MFSFASFAVAASYGLACGSIVFVAGLKMIAADDRTDTVERARVQ